MARRYQRWSEEEEKGKRYYTKVTNGEKDVSFTVILMETIRTLSTVKGRKEKGNVIRKVGIFGSVKSPISFPDCALLFAF